MLPCTLLELSDVHLRMPSVSGVRDVWFSFCFNTAAKLLQQSACLVGVHKQETCTSHNMYLAMSMTIYAMAVTVFKDFLLYAGSKKILKVHF
jgi:hypothetical protein